MSHNQDDEWQPDAAGLMALETEIPVLTALRNFADEVVRLPWFTELGEIPDSRTKILARAYLDALGYPDADAVPVLNWDDALDAAASLDLNSEAWEAEEQLRAGLADTALQGISEEGLGVMLTHIASTLGPVLQDHVEEAIYMADELPDNIVDLAIGAGQQAAHGAALVLAAAAVEAMLADDMALGEEALNHPLMLKYRLFEQGRWPIALTGRTLNLF
ncbi:MAG: hypothetical protein VW981_00760 [Rhodobiaceae bacterium]